jgi:hypothetical protein
MPVLLFAEAEAFLPAAELAMRDRLPLAGVAAAQFAKGPTRSPRETDFASIICQTDLFS